MPYKTIEDAIAIHPNLKKYSPKARSAWFKAFNSCWFATKGPKDEGKCFRIAYSAANKVEGVKSIRELNVDVSPEEFWFLQIISLLDVEQDIGAIPETARKEIPPIIWENLAFHAGDRVVARSQRYGIPIIEIVLEIYNIRRSLRGRDLTPEERDYNHQNYKIVDSIHEDLIDRCSIELEKFIHERPSSHSLYRPSSQRLLFVRRLHTRKLEICHVEFTVQTLLMCLYLLFDDDDAVWRMDVEHAARLAFYESYLSGATDQKSQEAYDNAEQEEQAYLAQWLIDQILLYAGKPARRASQQWAEETEEILFNPHARLWFEELEEELDEVSNDDDFSHTEEEVEKRLENYYCVLPGSETSQIIVDEENNVVLKIRKSDSQLYSPLYWKMKALVSKIVHRDVPNIVPMEYIEDCDMIQQPLIVGSRASRSGIYDTFITDLSYLVYDFSGKGYKFITDIWIANAIRGIDGEIYIFDFTIDFHDDDFIRFQDQHPEVAELFEEMKENQEPILILYAPLVRRKGKG